ncbi:MAG: hypothetical protein WCI91_02650 [Candidatus Nomurabacteria bacterium]
MNFNPESPKPNTLKNEHLDPKFKPIIGGIYDRNNLDKETLDFLNDFKKNAINLDFKLNKEKFLSDKTGKQKEGTYLISQIDSNNKISEGYFDCLGVCFSGIDKNTKENISFISHQNPEALLENINIRQRFKDDLNKTMNNFIDRCVQGTIDIVIVGGNKDINYIDPIQNVDIEKMNSKQIQEYMDKQYEGPFEKYRKSAFFVSNIIFNKVNYYPVIISGPNSNIKEGDLSHDNALDLYFDTKNRHLYQVRAKNESLNNESFSAEEINSKVEKYK